MGAVVKYIWKYQAGENFIKVGINIFQRIVAITQLWGGLAAPTPFYFKSKGHLSVRQVLEVLEKFSWGIGSILSVRGS